VQISFTNNVCVCLQTAFRRFLVRKQIGSNVNLLQGNCNLFLAIVITVILRVASFFSHLQNALVASCNSQTSGS